MGLVAAGIGAGIMGDFMQMQGQESTNQTAMNIAAMNNNVMENLAENAMTYRVADLRRAGLNPMLAVGQSGMQVPTMQQPSIQNPAAGMGNIGNQVTSALGLSQTQAQIDNIKADTALKRANAPPTVYAVNDDGTPDFSRSAGGGLFGAQTAQQNQVNIDQGKALVANIQQQTKTGASQEAVNRIQEQMSQVNYSVLKQTQSWMVSQAIAEAKIDVANVSAAEAEAKIMGSSFGPFIKAAQSVLGNGPIGSLISGALQLHSTMSRSAPSTTQTSTFGPSGVYKGGSVTTTGR